MFTSYGCVKSTEFAKIYSPLEAVALFVTVSLSASKPES